MFYQQPPAGNPVCLTDAPVSGLRSSQIFAPYHPCFYASGTAALAAAICAAMKRKQVDRPEIILPAYGCPDLISAAVFAGARPVLVDLGPDRPWLDLKQLARLIGKQTVGIVAVDLFGILERFEALRELANSVDAVLIEDSAQAFPSSGESNIWHGDLVIVSFGRGKPVSLLGGGAVLHQGQPLGDLLPTPEALSASVWRDSAMYRLKAFLYNRMISPRLYWIPQGLPFLRLGETRYHPLTKLGDMDAERLALLPANLAAYQGQRWDIRELLSGVLEQIGRSAGGLIDLPWVTGVPEGRRLLRYPLLVDASLRDRLYQALRRAGLGPSLMYPRVLNEIPGLEELLEHQGDYPQARSFAERILTLPTHNGIRERDLAGIRHILSIFFADDVG
jgi:hypothetical protein